MSWTKERQDAAQKKVADFVAEYQTTMDQWKNSVQAGQATQGEAAVQDVLRRWRQHTMDLQAQSAAATQNQAIMDVLADLVKEVGEQKQILADLESEAVTRADQADSLNPKVRNSPYTNILGLQRTFRESTRTGIIIASVVFGVLALAALGFLIYSVQGQGAVFVPGAALASGPPPIGGLRT
jgi:transketolase